MYVMIGVDGKDDAREMDRISWSEYSVNGCMQ